MKVGDIIKTVGAGLLSSHPVGAGILSAVNFFLPDDEKLPEDATGEQVKEKISSLPPEQQLQIMQKEIDLEIKREEGWTERYKAMCEGDKQSTRPKIALMMAKVFSAVLLGFMIIIAYAVATEGFSVLEQPTVWTVFAVLTATPAGVLSKYFGELRREQNNRLNSLNGIGQGDSGVVSNLLNKMKGK